MRRFLPVLLTIAFLLTMVSCDTGSLPLLPGMPETVKETEKVLELDTTYMYELVPLRIPDETLENLKLVRSSAIKEDGTKQISYIYTDDTHIQIKYHIKNNDGKNKAYVAYFDWEGNYIRTIESPTIPRSTKYDDGIRYMFADYSLPDGTFIGVDCRTEEEEFNLFHYTADGEFLHDLYMEFERQNTLHFWTVGEDRNAFFGYGHLYIFDNNYNLLHSCVPDVELNAIFFREDGSICVQDWDGILRDIDPDTGITTPLSGTTKINHSQNLPLEYYRQEDTYYSVEEDGIYYKPIGSKDETEKVLLLDWLASGVVSEDTEILAIPDDEHMLILSQNNMDGVAEYAVLRKVPEGTTVAKEKVILRTYGLPLVLQRAAAQFNRTSDDYLIEIQDSYPHYTEDRRKIYEDYEERISADLFGTMAAGNIPDLFMPNVYTGMLLLNLEKQGYLADLSSLTHRLTGSARGAVTHGESCIQIPYVLTYNTIATTVTDQPLTAELLTEYAAGLEKGQYLFSEPIFLQKSLITAIQSTFVDKASGTCSFETPLFTDYLEVLGSLESLTNVKLGGIDPNTVELAMTLDTLPRTLKNGELSFLFVPVRNLRFMHLLRILYDGNDYSFCGFPDTKLVVESLNSLAVLKDGNCTEGAMAFLEFLLSTEVQSSEIIGSLGVPVTSDAVRTWLDNDWYFTYYLGDNYYYIQDNGKMLGMLTGTKLEYVFRQKEPDSPEYELKMEIQYTEAEKAAILSLLETESVSHHADPTLVNIINEEVYTYLSGDRSAEDTAHILQSRVSTYLAE